MKKMILFMTILFTALCVATGCNSEKGTAINDKKEILFQINNTSGADCVLTTGTYGSDEYRGGQESYDDDSLDAIDISDFTIKAGGSNPYKVSDASKERAFQAGSLNETSKKTFEYKVQCIAAGVVPGDSEQWCIEKPFVNVQDMTISGTYGESVAIEWDGSTFKQIK